MTAMAFAHKEERAGKDSLLPFVRSCLFWPTAQENSCEIKSFTSQLSLSGDFTSLRFLFAQNGDFE